MKVMLVGGNGQLGLCFRKIFPEEWVIHVTDSDSLDITAKDKVLETVSSFMPNVIVNAAAYTAVDKAETDCELAFKVNVIGPENLAYAAKINNCRLVHISTDYVFDGKAVSPYLETSTTNPLGVYGKTKLDGELAVLNILPDAIIIRTAWVFSEFGNNFLKTMLRLGLERESLSIVGDQRGCPTYAGDIAGTILDLIKLNAKGGIYHFCGDSEVSWFEFASFILSEAKRMGNIAKIPQLISIATSAYPTPAQRPAYSTLNTAKIQKLGIKPSNWKLAVTNVLETLR
ncbi:TPA: dTDP-4-dehydrorhamnose reductase [Klebsiella oxytoca]|jgi:dTDP-4-dehydrorhamnose reductase|uniref:dTDP-4-dehydrorhamnose reductase n=1 Tax=Klebsiella oxytoca TaxID=571 RepID=UPI0022465C55|nr:dTDP-4-dehydrorhamnose reductase [Klebsiella oxytoca]EKU2384053.1 dTDP-4-dehydrorhamnose reductase [Klebsiella oxytoca]ELR9653685.1 dTDP-4-dehydrorhamnose reductase [Klebsiella oxytoca]MCW9518861.1 dTDP-4-dehydrorhamnose reductase [Klebsiella oxytoca]MCW9628625.1 dTDP-4-dehydrorhamnose reductase [Klebsiella oxytoca]HBM7349477.1 dTDP-4-dehydrorhamnose reductase [Klebsiella oxytoca]